MLFELTGYDFQVAFGRLGELRIELDFAMELMIRFDGKPATELVSLTHGPQEELDQEVDEYLRCHRGELVDAADLSADERYVREQAGFALAAQGSFAPNRVAVCYWLVTKKFFTGCGDVEWPLGKTLKTLRTRMREKVETVAAIATQADDAVFLYGRTDLLPAGATLSARHADYISVRHQLENLLGRLQGTEKNQPTLIELGERASSGFTRFPPPIALPAVSGAQTKQPAVDLPPLSADASLVYELLLALPEHQAMTAPKIVQAVFDKHHKNLDESTLRKYIVPALKPYGLEHVPRIGYRIKPSRRTNNQ